MSEKQHRESCHHGPQGGQPTHIQGQCRCICTCPDAPAKNEKKCCRRCKCTNKGKDNLCHDDACSCHATHVCTQDETGLCDCDCHAAPTTKEKKTCKGCSDCLNSSAPTGEICLRQRECECHTVATKEEEWVKDLQHHLSVMFGLGHMDEREEGNVAMNEAVEYVRSLLSQAKKRGKLAGLQEAREMVPEESVLDPVAFPFVLEFYGTHAESDGWNTCREKMLEAIDTRIKEAQGED